MSETEQTAARALVEETVESAAAVERVEMDTIFELLSHPARRYVLTYLLRSDGFVSMTELVDYVMEKTTHTMTDREFRHRLTVSLTHTHLPKLADEEYVKYNVERQIVLPTDRTQLFAPYLEMALRQQQVIDDAIAEATVE